MTYQLEGTYIGNILVIERLPKQHMSKHMWKCKCLCGNYFQVTTAELTTTNTKRRRYCCGYCQWHIKHAEAYNSWQAAKQRCYTDTNKDYKNYGERGIKMSVEWRSSFQEFYKDMGDPPIDYASGQRMSLDRKDVNGDYCKDNCRWATATEQAANKR